MSQQVGFGAPVRRSPHIAVVEERFDVFLTDIYIGTRLDDGEVSWATSDVSGMDGRLKSPSAPGSGKPPHLELQEEEARALYEALGKHFGQHVTDAQQLRADYAHERGRVDKLTDALITIAARPS